MHALKFANVMEFRHGGDWRKWHDVMNQVGAALIPQNAGTTARFVEPIDPMNVEPMTSEVL
jgi:hypothetical protein